MRKRGKKFSPDDSAVRKGELLFVYGTLLKILNRPMHQVLASHANFVGPAGFQGKLYDLGNYPGAVPSKKASDKIRGEVYRMQNPEGIFRLLDEYEGKEFRRERVLISLENGKKVFSWIYLYKRPTNGLKVMPSGDYKQYR
jgi:gamma-glutamylcyclotransferase (GGCT)/AIG2-like uncharacterized protein YtfP